MAIFSLLSIIIGNTLPLVGRLFFGWDTSYFLFLYWTETIVIFVFTYLKMKKAEGVPDPKRFYVSNKTKQEKLGNYSFIGSIFLILLGGMLSFFTFVVGSKYWVGPAVGTLPPFDARTYVTSFIFLVGGHIINYWDFIKKELYKTTSVEEAQGFVFARILLIFFIVLVGVFALGPNLIRSIIPLIIFVILKNIGDSVVYYASMFKR